LQITEPEFQLSGGGSPTDNRGARRSAPTRDRSSAREESLGFWVDDEAKTLTFPDNTPLTVTRLDRSWISADRDGVFYELDRRDGTLSYAGSTTKAGVSTTIVGSGRCVQN